MDEKILEKIADALEGTDKHIWAVLEQLGIKADPDDVKRNLKDKWGLGQCFECNTWTSDLPDGDHCEVCLGERTE